MAWDCFPVESGQLLTADMLNELRYAAAERSIPVPAAVERGKSRAGALSFLSTLMTNVRQYSYSFGYWEHYSSPTDYRWIGYTYQPSTADRKNIFEDALGAGITDWRYPVSAGKLITAACLNDIYRVLDKLRYRTMGYSSATYKVATTQKSGAPYWDNVAPPDDPAYHWFRDTWTVREDTTQQAEFEAAKADALARLQLMDYGPDNATGGFPPAGSSSFPGYSWPGGWLWAGAAWVAGYQWTCSHYGWPPTVPYFYYLGYYGQAQKRLAMKSIQTTNPVPTDANIPNPDLQEVYVPAIVYCGRLYTITSGSHAALARPINVQVRQGTSMPDVFSQSWGSGVDTIAVDGLRLDSSSALKRCYKFTTDTAPTVALVCDSSVEGLDEATLGPIIFPNDGGNIAPPYSAYASPNCEWVDGGFSDSSSLPPIVCKKAYVKCTS